MIWKPHVTVAAVLEREGKFLLVEEETDEGVRFNQPAGHLECLEALPDAVIREALEETGYHFVPQYLIGVYNWHHEAKDITYLRFAFGGEISGHEAERPLDDGIIAAHWLMLHEIRALEAQHRSPLILRCIEDFLAGKRFPAGTDYALRMKGRLFFILLGLYCTATSAEERVTVCFNYGCQGAAEVVYSAPQLAEVRALLDDAANAAHERELISVVIGRLLGWAGKLSPISADRGGNQADDGVYGRMDCIDHSTTTTRLLEMLQKIGGLRWHRVLEREVRTRFLIFDHWTAVIEEEPAAPFRGERPAMRLRYAIDSWFYDNGKPAIVMPLNDWLNWEGPNVKQ